jgi:hypothetical protein
VSEHLNDIDQILARAADRMAAHKPQAAITGLDGAIDLYGTPAARRSAERILQKLNARPRH